MSQASTLISQHTSAHIISYGHGKSSLGGFLTAIDDKGVRAILMGDDRAQLLRDLQAVFPDSRL